MNGSVRNRLYSTLPSFRHCQTDITCHTGPHRPLLSLSLPELNRTSPAANTPGTLLVCEIWIAVKRQSCGQNLGQDVGPCKNESSFRRAILPSSHVLGAASMKTKSALAFPSAVPAVRVLMTTCRDVVAAGLINGGVIPDLIFGVA